MYQSLCERLGLCGRSFDPARPQALIYEPDDGRMTLVGVEFILDSASWLAANNNTAPALDGQVVNFVPAPNRFAITSFFELHVWAWRDNPQGSRLLRHPPSRFGKSLPRSLKCWHPPIALGIHH
jgi:hypothetical protein